MAELRAVENRLILTVPPRDAWRVRQIPGARWNATESGWMFPRQAGVYPVLDAVFGREGWSASAEIVAEADAARGRVWGHPETGCSVRLEGSQLSVGCAINDRELVKRIPGYRWNPNTKQWIVAALPVALDILREGYGTLLVVSGEAEEYVERKRTEFQLDLTADQNRVQAPAVSLVDETPPAHVTEEFRGLEPTVTVDRTDVEVALEVPSNAPDVLARILAVLERIEGKLEVIGTLSAAGVVSSPYSGVGQHRVAGADLVLPGDLPEAPREEADLIDGWIAKLRDGDPQTVFEEVRAEQVAGGDPSLRPLFRALTGIALSKLGKFDDALEAVGEGLDAPLPNAELDALAGAALEQIAFALLNDHCGPESPISDVRDLHKRLYDEIVEDAGFDGSTVGSSASRDILAALVRSGPLRRVHPALSDYVEIVNLLAQTRGAPALARQAVRAVLEKEGMHPDAFALATMLLANVSTGRPCCSSWVNSWPQGDSNPVEVNGERLASTVVERAAGCTPETAAWAGLSALRCLAGRDSSPVGRDSRRGLLQLVSGPAGAALIPYAQFLTVFHDAKSGEPLNFGKQYPGFHQTLAKLPLRTTSVYIGEVMMMGDSSSTAAKVIAEHSYLDAFKLGVSDPEQEVLELLDVVVTGPRAGGVLNEMSQLVEVSAQDPEMPLHRSFSQQQRQRLYERTLQITTKMGHDKDSRVAFTRLADELRSQGKKKELRKCCEQYQSKPYLAIPAKVELLEMRLQSRENFEELAEELRTSSPRGDVSIDVSGTLAGLAEIYPQLASWLDSRQQAETAEQRAQRLRELSGKRLLLIGGHKWLESDAKPVLETGWGMKVKWFDPEGALTRNALESAKGSSDLVVINVRCIGHAGSERIKRAAEGVGSVPVMNEFAGVGALLNLVSEHFVPRPAVAAAPVTPASSRNGQQRPTHRGGRRR